MVVVMAGVAVVTNVPVQDEARLDALAWMNAGVAAAEGGAMEEATACFARAVAGHPESPEARYNLGLALAVQGRYAEAVEQYEVAARLGENLPGLDYNLAVALERVGRVAEARRHYERAAARDAKDVAAREAVRRLGGTFEESNR